MKSNNDTKTDPKKKRRSYQLPKWPGGIPLPKSGDMTFTVPDDLEVILTREAFSRLFGFAYSTSREISCLGPVRREGAKFIVERFYLLQQVGTSSHTEIDETAIAELIEKLLAEGKSEEASRIRCWAHSHPGMGVFWSDRDKSTCRNLVTDYLVSVVVSNDFSIKCRIDLGGALPATLDNVPVKYELPADLEEMKRYGEEVKALVKDGFDFPETDSPSDAKTERGKIQEYCEYCGSWHEPGACPFTEPDDWYLDDADLYPFGDVPTLFEDEL